MRGDKMKALILVLVSVCAIPASAYDRLKPKDEECDPTQLASLTSWLAYHAKKDAERAAMSDRAQRQADLRAEQEAKRKAFAEKRKRKYESRGRDTEPDFRISRSLSEAKPGQLVQPYLKIHQLLDDGAVLTEDPLFHILAIVEDVKGDWVEVDAVCTGYLYWANAAEYRNLLGEKKIALVLKPAPGTNVMCLKPAPKK
jgi:hypothetical protein